MDLPIVPILGFVAFIGALILLARHQAKKRTEAMAGRAAELGFRFTDQVGEIDRGRLLAEFDGFYPFGQGERPRIKNLMVGERSGCRWTIFDYEYETRTTDSNGAERMDLHRYGVVANHTSVSFPALSISSEGALGGLRRTFGGGDLQFESEAFNKRFRVLSDDARRAHDLLHPTAMELLMSFPVRHWQFRRACLAVIATDGFKPDQLERVMDEIESFVKTVPEYYRQDHPAVAH